MEKGENQSVARREINQNFADPKETQNGALTPPFAPPVFPTLPHTLPGSSVAEQVTVNHLVVGSIPTRAASEGGKAASQTPPGGPAVESLPTSGASSPEETGYGDHAKVTWMQYCLTSRAPKRRLSSTSAGPKEAVAPTHTAAQERRRGATLVTANVKQFRRVRSRKRRSGG